MQDLCPVLWLLWVAFTWDKAGWKRIRGATKGKAMPSDSLKEQPGFSRKDSHEVWLWILLRGCIGLPRCPESVLGKWSPREGLRKGHQGPLTVTITDWLDNHLPVAQMFPLIGNLKALCLIRPLWACWKWCTRLFTASIVVLWSP